MSNVSIERHLKFFLGRAIDEEVKTILFMPLQKETSGEPHTLDTPVTYQTYLKKGDTSFIILSGGFSSQVVKYLVDELSRYPSYHEKPQTTDLGDGEKLTFIINPIKTPFGTMLIITITSVNGVEKQE